MLAAVIFISSVWSPGINTIVVLEVKYNSVSFAYSESVAQCIELLGQDEHEALPGRVGMTQYTLSAEQQERLLRSSAAIRTMDGLDWDIIAL